MTKLWKRTALATLLVAAATMLVTAAVAAAAAVIHEGEGAGKARLGQLDTTAASYLGIHGDPQLDDRYDTKVYVTYVGRQMKNRRYPCELHSTAAHKIFQFTFNSSAFATAKGIRVGSAEPRLVALYPSLRAKPGTVYNHYILGKKRPFTDFWVSNKTHRVYQIVIRSK